ncbi:hypothetical protein HYW43_02130 [Candidatus Daviesbacteria bacterium]|nr:hypothetical protein [Candidatus Daviesbacteria bacterium]
MQKGFAPILILLGILVIGLGIAGAWYTKLIQIPRFEAERRNLDETASWKTYTNPEFGYSIKYNPNYVISEEPKSDTFLSLTSFKTADKTDKNEFSIQVRNSTLAEEVQYQKWTVEGHIPAKLTKVEKITLNGFSAELLEYTPEQSETGKTLFVIVNNNKYSYVISGNPQVVSQLIPTFKFLDSSQADETISWKTYIDEVNKLSLKYPERWHEEAIEGVYGSVAFLTPVLGDTRGMQAPGIFINVVRNENKLSSEEYVNKVTIPYQKGSVCENSIKTISEIQNPLKDLDVTILEGLCGVLEQGPYMVIARGQDIIILSSSFTSQVSKGDRDLVYSIYKTFRLLDKSNWQIYKKEDIFFGFPPGWVQKPIKKNSSSLIQEFNDSSSEYILSFSSTENYNQLTDKPYNTIDEYIGLPYKIKTIFVGGQEGRQAFPRAGSENLYAVDFFSKDSRWIYRLALRVGNKPEDVNEKQVADAEELFNQIVSTFKFK